MAPLAGGYENDILAAIRRASADCPHEWAVIPPEGAPWSRSQLLERAESISQMLATAGSTAGDLVAVYATRCPELAAVLLGVQIAGCGILILDAAWPASRIRACIRAARPSVWLDCTGCAESFLSTEQTHLADCTIQAAFRLVHGRWLADGSARTSQRGRRCSGYVTFTSGTSGAPQGLAGGWAAVAHFLDWYGRQFGFRATDRFSCMAGLSHDPLLREILMPLRAGAQLCIPAHDRSPQYLVAWLRANAITVVHVTPGIARAMLAARGALPDIRYVFFGGEKLDYALVRQVRRLVPNAKLVNLYGTTETPQGIAWFAIDDADSGEGVVPVGRGIANAQLLVLNEANGLAGIGELGEIYVRTPYLTEGYLDDDELTRAKFIANPLANLHPDLIYRTGDLGRYRADGVVEIAGRRDRQLKIRGFRVEPSEVESALCSHPGVSSAAVLSINGRNGILLAAFVVPKGGGLPNIEELRGYLVERLPNAAVPDRFVAVPEIPLTPNGKVDTRALEHALVTADHDETAFVTPTAGLESTVAAIWREVLGRDRIGAEDNFFDAGGHSLLLLQVQERIAAATGKWLSLVTFFKYPTIRALARHLGANQCQAHTATEDRQRAARRRSAMAARSRPKSPER